MDLQDEQIITLFFDVCRRNQRYHDRVSGSGDPSRGQYYCLAILDGAGTVSQRELADLLHIRPASAGELLNRLEAKGWIDRRPSPRDKRVRLVELTSVGKAKIDAVRQEKKDNDKMMLAPLRAEERQRFFEILTKINNYYLHMEQELNKRNE